MGEVYELWGVERRGVRCDGNEGLERGLLRSSAQPGNSHQGGDWGSGDCGTWLGCDLCPSRSPKPS